MTDPIADMLARINNGLLARKASVLVPHSKVKQNIAQVLVDEGFLVSLTFADPEKKVMTLGLKYDTEQKSVINGIKRRSRPGQRLYARSGEIPHICSGMGIAVLTTSKGVMTDSQARKIGVGGELVCEVW